MSWLWVGHGLILVRNSLPDPKLLGSKNMNPLPPQNHFCGPKTPRIGRFQV